jgi:hypothetical protein
VLKHWAFFFHGTNTRGTVFPLIYNKILERVFAKEKFGPVIEFQQETNCTLTLLFWLEPDLFGNFPKAGFREINKIAGRKRKHL